MKTEALLQLARLRQSSRLEGYVAIGDFHDGIFECDHISPWTKSSANVDAEIMVVGQDWSSSGVLGSDPPDLSSVKFGFDPKFPTNRNLDTLLDRHFGLKRSECYLTNLFPYVKTGNASAGIRPKDLVDCAKKFTLPEIEIVSPLLVIALGLRTFTSLMHAAGLKRSLKMADAVSSPFRFAGAVIHCVAHTGAFGMNNRGREQVDQDWKLIAESMPPR